MANSPSPRFSSVRLHASPTFELQYFQIPLLFVAAVDLRDFIFIRLGDDDARDLPFIARGCAAGRQAGCLWICRLCSGVDLEQQGKMPFVHDPTASSEALPEES